MRGLVEWTKSYTYDFKNDYGETGLRSSRYLSVTSGNRLCMCLWPVGF